MKQQHVKYHLWLRCTLSLLVCAGCSNSVTHGPKNEMNLDFRKVVKSATGKVFPAVVFINALQETHQSGEKESQKVSGSGVLISDQGELITNWHVIDKAVEIRCLLYDGRHFDAEIVGADKDLDVALLKLQLPDDYKPIPFAELSNSENMKEGDFVMAMGAPWGMARSVSIGIVSCTNRYLDRSSEYTLWLQTDAAINPGNSGGPLVDTSGRIVGLTTMGMLQGGDMGFALPSSIIGTILPRIREHEEVSWSWTGLRLQAIRDFERNIYFKGDQGVIVASTDPRSPARTAGIKDGDRIMKIGRTEVNGLTEESLPSVRRLLGLLPKNEPVTIKLVRDGVKKRVKLTPREKGKVEGEELDCPRWDMTFKTINQFDNPDLYFYQPQGVFVYGMKYPGNAQNTNMSRNDIILEIDGERTANLDDVKRIHKRTIDNVDKKPRILFKILRNGLIQQYILDFSRDYEEK